MLIKMETSAGGGTDISGLIDNYIVDYSTVYTSEIILTSVVGIKTVTVEVNGSAGCKVNGYIGTTKTDNISSGYITGSQNIDVSAYERISVQAGSNVGHSVKVKVID